MMSKRPSVLARLTPLDYGIVGAGVLAFVFSFVDYYEVTVRGVTTTDGAWHGLFGWFAASVALLGALVVVIASLRPGRPPYRTVLAVFAIATASVIAALFTSGFDTSRAHAVGVAADTGHGYGYWVSLIAIIVGTGLALTRVQQTAGPRDVRKRLPNLGGERREG